MTSTKPGLRIAINDAIRRRGVSGTARAVELIDQALTATGHQVIRLAPEHAPSNKVLNAVRATWWDFVGFDRAAADADVLIFPCNYGAAPSGRPALLWIQDTMALDNAMHFDPLFALYTRATFGPSARHADVVVTASEDARRRIVRRWPSTSATTRVIPWPSPLVRSSVRTRVPGRPTVVMVGATEPHKQHVTGIEAVRLLRDRTGRDVRLRVLGPAGRAEQEVRNALAHADPGSDWTAREVSVPQAELDGAYAGAWLLLQCSSDEGFCLPLVESASFALPAVHTGAGSMSEVHPTADAKTDSAHGLAEAMAGLLDPGRYRGASESALHVAERWRPRDFSAALDQLVRSAAHHDHKMARR